MKKLLSKIFALSQTATAKNTYIVFLGNFVAAFLGMLSMVFITRRLGPSKFGAFSVSFSLLSLLANVGDLGLNFALVKEVSKSRAKNEPGRFEKIFWTVFWIKLAFCLFLGTIGILTNRYISISFLKSPASMFANKLVFIMLFPSVFYDLVRVGLQALKRFKESALIYILANVLKLLLIIILFLCWPNFSDYIWLYLLTPFLASLFFLKTINLKIKLIFSKIEFKRLFGFASWMAISVILAAIGENLNIFMVSAKLSSFETGIYAAAEKFTLPITIFTGALGTVLITRTSEFLELSHIKKFLKKVVLLQGLIFFLFLLALPFSFLLPYILGGQYSPSVVILQILLVGNFFRTAITLLNAIFYPLNKSIIFALDAFIQVVLLLILNNIFIPLFQAKGAAISLFFVNVVIFIFNYFFLFYQLRLHEKKAINLG